MFIKDLKPNQAVDSITVEITDKGEVKELTNFRGKARVTNAKVKDETGQCTLSLWNDEIDKYSTGQKVRITNGWCKEYRGELQLSSGKYGRIEVAAPEGAVDAKEAKAKEKPVQKKPKKKQAKKQAEESDEEEIVEDDKQNDSEFFSEADNDPYVKYEDRYVKEL